MVVLAWKHRESLVQGRPLGELCLRVIGTERDGETVRLAAPKCSIGSAEGCTLRLRARGVSPLHCVILRGARGTVARAWASNVRLNGQPLVDALLVSGDRLAIGPVEFEVFAAPEVAPATPWAGGLPAPRTAHVTATDKKLAPRGTADRNSIETARLRVRKLVARLRDLQRELELAREQSEGSRLATQAREDQLSAACDQLERECASEAERQQQWQSQCDRQRQELEAWGERCQREREELSLAREQLERERRDLNVESAAIREELQRERAVCLAEREAARKQESELAERLLQLNAQTAQFEQEQQAWKAWKAGEEQRLSEQGTSRVAQDAELEELRARFEQSRQQGLDEQHRLQAELAQQRLQLEQEKHSLATDLEAQRAALEQEARERRAALEQQSAELRKRDAEIGQRERLAENAATECEQRRADLEAQRAKLEQDQQAWQRTCAEQDRRDAQRRQELQQQTAQLRAREETLESRLRDLETTPAPSVPSDPPAGVEREALRVAQAEIARIREELERERSEYEARLRLIEQSQQELAEQQADLIRQRARFESQCQTRQLELEDEAQRLAARAAEIDERELTWEQVARPAREHDHDRQHEAPLASLQSEHDIQETQREESEAERRERERQLATEELLRRINSQMLGTDSDACDVEEDEEAVLHADSAAQPALQTLAPVAEDDETTIADYMAALLKRTRGTGSAEPVAVNEPARNKRKSDGSPRVSSEDRTSRQAAPPEKSDLDLPPEPAEFVRRPQPVPLDPEELMAMRELANTHAQISLDKHAHKRLVRRAAGRFAASGFCLAGMLAVLQWAPEGASAVRIEGLVLAVAAMYFLVAGMRSASRLLRARQRRKATMAQPVASATANDPPRDEPQA